MSVLSLLLFDLPVLAAALLIGIVTGRWMIRGRPARMKHEDEPKS